MSAIGSESAPRVLTQNTPFSRISGPPWLLRLMQTSTVGGASETEHTAVAVKPVLPAGPAVVTTCTAAPRRLIASRKQLRLDGRDRLGPDRLEGAGHRVVGALVDPAHGLRLNDSSKTPTGHGR